jgi:phosphosulfolactate phosphohydrolase-like enzyme
MPSYLNVLDLQDDVNYTVNMELVSSTVEVSYETIILRGVAPGNLSLDDQIIVNARENSNNLTEGYEAVYHDNQYKNNSGQVTTEPMLAHSNYGNRLSHNNINDISDITYCTYVKLSRVIYAVFKRRIPENLSDQKPMKDTPCNGTIQATNIGVSTQITIGWKYRPLSASLP